MNFSRSARRKRSICLPLCPVPNRTAGIRGCLRVACACTQSIETPNHSATSRELSKRSEPHGNECVGRIDRGWVDIVSSLITCSQYEMPSPIQTLEQQLVSKSSCNRGSSRCAHASDGGARRFG